MRRKTRKSRFWLLGVCVLFCLLVYSCLQNEWLLDYETTDKVVAGNNKELTASKAEQWYNATNLPVATVRSLSSESEILTKPKWAEAQESRKGDFEVVETPLLVRGSAIFLDQETNGKFDPKKGSKKIRNIARMVVIKNTKTGEICNFIMIFVGTYNYLMNTRTFGKNTYLHREPDFDGDAFFYKPGQGLVNGWKYKAGKIVATISPGVEGGSHITSTRGMYQNCSDECTVVARNDCWGEDYWDDEFGAGVASVCQTNYYEECTQVCQWVDDGQSEEPWNPSGGGGGYNPGGSPDDGSLTAFISLYNSNSNLSKTQKNNLGNVFKELANSRVFESMTDALIRKGVKISFNMISRPDKIAYFNPGSNGIYFTNDSHITIDNVKEEFIHAVQFNLFYPNMDNSKSNYEFEAKVLRDIDCILNTGLCPIIGTIGMENNVEYCTAYENLVYRFDNENTIWNESCSDIYKALGKAWYQYPGTFDSSLKPELLNSYLK